MRVLLGLRRLSAQQRAVLVAAAVLSSAVAADLRNPAGAALGFLMLLTIGGLIQLRRRDAQHHATVATELHRARRAVEDLVAGNRRLETTLHDTRKVLLGQHQEQLAALDRSRYKSRDDVARLLASQGQETEALLQLYRDVAPRAPMPSSGLWALNPTALLHLLYVIERRKPSLVVELGSGTSTLWTSYALERTGGRLISLEHDPEYAARTRALLAEHSVPGLVEVREAPLRPVEIDGAAYRWYDLDAVADLADIDLLVVDGPPGATGPEARYPALPLLADRLAATATVVLDDVNRADEHQTLRRWIGGIAGLSREADMLGPHAVLTYTRSTSAG